MLGCWKTSNILDVRWLTDAGDVDGGFEQCQWILVPRGYACGSSSQIICVTNTTADDILVSDASCKTYIPQCRLPGYSYGQIGPVRGYYGTFSDCISDNSSMITGALAC